MIPNLRVLSLALMLAPCLAAAQSFTANGPFETGHFAPLNGHQRWLRWASEDGGSADLHLQSFASAAYLQAIADPAAWNRSTGGFVRRLGSSYGANIVQNSVHDSLSAAEGTDPRYFSCACSGFFHRSGHALRMTFFTYGRGGRETIDIPQLAGAYGGSMMEAMWWPHHYTALVQGVQTGHIEVGFVGAVHLVQEFSPELKRLLHLRPRTANQAP